MCVMESVEAIKKNNVVAKDGEHLQKSYSLHNFQEYIQLQTHSTDIFQRNTIKNFFYRLPSGYAPLPPSVLPFS